MLVMFAAGCGPMDATNSTTTTTTTTTTCTSTDTYADYGAAFLAANCRTCHQHVADFSTQAEVALSAATMRAQISTGRMPEGVALSGAEKTRVLAWLACGAP